MTFRHGTHRHNTTYLSDDTPRCETHRFHIHIHVTPLHLQACKKGTQDTQTGMGNHRPVHPSQDLECAVFVQGLSKTLYIVIIHRHPKSQVSYLPTSWLTGLNTYIPGQAYTYM